MSFHAWRNRGRANKQEFVCVANSYHGETIGALGVTDVALFKDAYDPLIRHAHVVASPDARGALPGETAADVAGRALADVRRLFVERGDRIAALIVEPLVQCAAGMAMHDPSYVRGLRTLCDEFGVHLIADEIAVGCGHRHFLRVRAGRRVARFPVPVEGISGGYLPLSLVLTRDDVFATRYDDDTTRGFLHSHSYTGNPLACRAAVATLDLFERDDVLAANARKSATLRAALAPLDAHPQVRHLRERGTLFAFDVALDATRRALLASLLRARAGTRAAAAPIGTTVYLMPPYVMSDDDIAWLAQSTRDTLDATLAEIAG